MAYEEAPYNVVYSTDTYEIRHYKDRLVVEVVNKNDDNSFRTVSYTHLTLPTILLV